MDVRLRETALSPDHVPEKPLPRFPLAKQPGGRDRPSPLLGLFRDAPAGDSRWLHSYYVQKPEAVDDPYRYYRW